ncbi:hypothetical protein GCM10010412_041770 [Nonomuraea recticatena]|uniref:Uncharacterized protein n=1 Tax=Nonomuraea recticatena TaxID=46178 RepID=A0ABP6ED72_9ACTN
MDPDFDPEATGVIPKITLPVGTGADPSTSADAEESGSAATDQDAPGSERPDSDETDSEETGTTETGTTETGTTETGTTETGTAVTEAADAEAAETEAAETGSDETGPEATGSEPAASDETRPGASESSGPQEPPEDSADPTEDSAEQGEDSVGSDEDLAEQDESPAGSEATAETSVANEPETAAEAAPDPAEASSSSAEPESTSSTREPEAASTSDEAASSLEEPEADSSPDQPEADSTTDEPQAAGTTYAEAETTELAFPPSQPLTAEPASDSAAREHTGPAEKESEPAEEESESGEEPGADASYEVDDEDTNPALRLPDFSAAGEDVTEITTAVRLPTPPKAGSTTGDEDEAEETPGVADTTVALRLPSASVKVGHAPEAPAVPVRRPQQAAPEGKQTRLASLVRGAPRWLPVVLVLEGLLMYVLALRVSPGPLRGVDPADIGGLGLISAMPLSAFFAIVIMIVSFFVTVTQSTDRKFLLLFQIAAITFALHGAGAIVADVPRFPTAYVHAGFVDFISRTGETAPMLDARMAWPGFFALFAFVGKAAGITDFTTILNWTPLLSNLLYLLPFVLILRQVVATTRARWFAALLFILVQWIGQDYFSPQGFTFALYLAFVAILLRWFGKVDPRTKPMPDKGRVRKLLARLDSMLPGELAITGTFRADKLLMLLMLIALLFAATASHQITPFMMLGVLTAFLLVKRTSLTWALPFFFGLVVLAWISYQTVGFWQGNMESIFGGIGRLLENLQRGTGDRIQGSDPIHALVLQTRLGICATVLLLAAVGLLRRLRRGVFDRAALVLLCVPVLAMGLQSYGGEMGLRVYMFMLPGACLLAAYAFFPNLPADSEDASEETVPFRQRNVRFNPRVTKIVSIVLAACVALALSMAFLVARYGNEKFERVTTGEVAAMRYVYAHDKPSARVLYLVPKVGPETTPILPWGEKDFEKVDFTQQALVHKDPANITEAVATLKAGERNTFLAVTRGQAAYLQLNEGFPADWYDRFVAALDRSKEIKKVYSNDDAALYTWKKFVKGSEIPDPRYVSGGPGDPGSPWDLVGVLALGVTWLTLFAYEVIRLHGRDKAPRARRRLLMVAVPAFLLAVGVIVERFLYIGLNMFQ